MSDDPQSYRDYVRRQVGGFIRVLQALSAGDFDVAIHRERDDELGMLAVGLKMMTDDVRELVDTEKALREEIARKVEELEQTNVALRQAQSQLVQNEKMVGLGQLVAGVAHEINNPIGVIYANVRLMQEIVGRLEQDEAPSGKTRGQVVKLLARCLEAGQRTKQIVQDLRTFSRIDEAERKEVDIHHSLDATLNLLALREQEGIKFHREFGDLPPVECYAGQLNQVFMNLLMNACDALEPRKGGHVTVRTRLRKAGELPEWAGDDPQEPIVTISVIDDGPGVSPDLTDRIFDPFFTTKDVGKGTGLGLSISYRVAGRHGGRIRVESPVGEGGGGGSAFHVEFPLRRSAAS